MRGVDRAFGRMPGTWVERTVFSEREGRPTMPRSITGFGEECVNMICKKGRKQRLERLLYPYPQTNSRDAQDQPWNQTPRKWKNNHPIQAEPWFYQTNHGRYHQIPRAANQSCILPQTTKQCISIQTPPTHALNSMIPILPPLLLFR
jgi:hypothetical protein